MPDRTSSRTSCASPAHARPPRHGRAPAGAGFSRGTLPILTAAVLWGTTGTASSLAPAGAPAASVGATGLSLGGLLLFASAPGTRRLLGTRHRGERWLLAVGMLAVAGYQFSFYPAVARTGVAVTTVVALGGAPVFTGLLARAITGSRLGRSWAAATAGAVIGCGMLVLGQNLTGHGAAHADPGGIVLAALAGLSYATYSVVGGHLIGRGHRARAVMGTMFGGAGLLVLPVVAACGTGWLGTARGAAVALHLALLTTFLAYLLFGHGLQHTPPAVAVTLTLAEPAVAALLGIAVLGERLPALSWCGLGALALALAVLSVPGRIARRRTMS